MDPNPESTASELLEKVTAELKRYEHHLLEFGAVERDGTVYLVIGFQDPPPDAHVYEAPLHPRDLVGPQFDWTLQSFLYDCMHDYLVELFIKTPQSETERG